MFVADRTANRILQFDGRTGELQAEVATVDRPSSVRLGPDGELYVAAFGQSEVLRFNPAARTMTSRFYRDTEILEEPVELLFRASELVVLGHDTHNAVGIDPTGTKVRDVGYPDMRGAHDFTFGADGLLYVATGHDVSLGTAIQVWDVETAVMVRHFGTLDQLANATGIVERDGDFYVTDYERGTLIRFTGDTPTVIAKNLQHPICVELGPDGMLYVIDERGIHRFEIDGSYDELFVATGEDLIGPRGLSFALVDDLVAKD